MSGNLYSASGSMLLHSIKAYFGRTTAMPLPLLFPFLTGLFIRFDMLHHAHLYWLLFDHGVPELLQLKHEPLSEVPVRVGRGIGFDMSLHVCGHHEFDFV